MRDSPVFPGQRLFGTFYAGTVLFLVLDFGFHVNVRLAFLDGYPAWRAAYYLFCALCFVVIWRFPAWSNVVAATESLFNVSALILHMGSRVVTVTDAVLENGRAPVTPDEIFNFLISGSAAYLAFWLRGRRVRADLAGAADRS